MLAAPEDGFARALEMLALKKSANTKVFNEIKFEIENFLKEKHIVNVLTEVDKLRKKYALIKPTWRTLHNRATTKLARMGKTTQLDYGISYHKSDFFRNKCRSEIK